MSTTSPVRSAAADGDEPKHAFPIRWVVGVMLVALSIGLGGKAILLYAGREPKERKSEELSVIP